MINTPQDYQLVTPVGQIDGGILPARDVAADGSAHAVRAEDLCFALEAVKERDFDGRAALVRLPVPTHVVKREDWNRVWLGLRVACFGANGSSGVRAVDAKEQFAGTPMKRVETGYESLEEFYPNAFLASCHTGNVASPVENNVFWRKFYYDLKRSDRLYVPAYGAWTASGRYTHWDGRTGQVAANNAGGIQPTGQFFPGYLHDLEYRYVDGKCQRTASGVSYSTLMRTGQPLQGNVASAVAVAEYMLEVKGVGKTMESYVFARSFPCTVASGGIQVSPAVTLPAPGFDLVATCEELGHPFPAETAEQSWAYAYLSHTATYLVAKYNFRTNNLNDANSRAYGWNWTP